MKILVVRMREDTIVDGMHVDGLQGCFCVEAGSGN